jgi:FkbM family methyltransferase
MAMLRSRVKYYAASVPTLVMGIRNWRTMLPILLGLRVKTLPLLHLRNGLVFRVRDAMDIWIIKETCLDGDYEPGGFTIQADWLVLDLGAGLGEFAVSAAKKCLNGKVYAFEPFPESFFLLKENISLNRLANIVACPYAVGAKVERMWLNTSSGVPVLFSSVMDDGAGSNAISVQGINLDEIFKTFQLDQCDMLKIDCEGAEYDILFHADALTLVKINRICLEYHNGITRFEHTDLVRFLEHHGFSVALRPSPVYAHTGLLYASK